MLVTVKILTTLLLCFAYVSFSHAFDFYQPHLKPGEGSKLHVAPEIKNVHVIFMNHLDVGYDGIPVVGIINNVLNTYFTEYFPRAIKVYQDLKNLGFVETFRYTSHPWLVDLYLNCPPNLVLSGVKLQCPNAAQRQAFIQAIKAGVIEWHAGPMNMYYEIMDPLMLQMSLNVSRRLDVMFDKKKMVRVVSQRDVPGMPVSAIPLMSDNGIIGFTNGINSGSAPAEFPLIARWRYGEKELMYVQNPAGYPNNPGPYPAKPGGVGSDQCRWLPGMTDALCFAFRTDNSGPPADYKEVLSNYDTMRGQFPNANIFASTLETYFEILWQHREKAPIRTEEIGDTWVQGAGSDPRKMAEYKAVMRVMTECNAKGLCDFTDERLINSSRFLIKLPEHTAGLNTAGDSSHWNNVAFQQIKDLPYTHVLTNSWLEQRNFTYMARDALGDHPVRAKVDAALAELRPKIPQYKEQRGERISYSQRCAAPAADITFAEDGSISGLVVDGNALLTPGSRIGRLMYRTYNETDTAFFLRYYSMGWNTGFGKGGSTANAHPKSQFWPLKVTAVIKRSDSCAFDVRVQHTDPVPQVWYGGAAEYWLSYSLTSAGSLDVTAVWVNKTATRLMEAVYVDFSPDVGSTKWTISKVGLPVDPYTVVKNGSQWQQGVDEGGVTLVGTKHEWNIKSLDSVFVSPWTNNYGPTVWPAPLATIPRSPGIRGMAFPLTNNVWNTNFIFWYPYIDEDSSFMARFRVRWVKAKENTKHILQFHPRGRLPVVF